MNRALGLILAGAVIAVLGVLEISGKAKLNPALRPAAAAAADIAETSAWVYVSLRIVNAALSTAQEIELGASVGAQASIQPLKVLEPVDDTVERVADVVFAVAAGAALAVVGLEPVTALGLILLGAGLTVTGIGRHLGHSQTVLVGDRAVRIGASVGLLVPLVFAAGVVIGDRATEAQWRDATAQLEQVTSEARIVLGDGVEGAKTSDETSSAGSLFGRLGATLGSAGNGVADAVSAVDRYRRAAVTLLSDADVLFNATLVIIGVFVLRSVVLPALLLWAALMLLRRIATGSTG
jgi:hypothetical protein